MFCLHPRYRADSDKTSGPPATRGSSYIAVCASRRGASCTPSKRVFRIDVERCGACGGTVKVIACIEDPVVIRKILAHLNNKGVPTPTGLLPESRAPPHVELFD